MSSALSATGRWAARLSAAGASERAVSAWRTLQTAIASHQGLLRDEGIGAEVSERDRVRVNARRVGLKAPLFADEIDFSAAVRQEAGNADGEQASDGHTSCKDKLTHAEDVARAVARANTRHR